MSLAHALASALRASGFAALALVAASLAACSSDAGTRETGGRVAGVWLGNVVGDAAGDRLAGVPTGTAFGGFLGNRIGAALDDEDRRCAYEAQMRALKTGPTGVPVAWRNPDSGRYGNIVPGPAYQTSGTYCRGYTETVYIDGTPQFNRGTACRRPDGTWSIAY